MRLAIVASILLLCTASVHAKIYKWTDADGRVHYSASPPPDAQASEFRVAPSSAATSESTPATSAAPAADDSDEETEASEQAQLYKENCETSRRNLTLLEDPSIRTFREDGKDPVSFTEEERQARIERARRMVAAFCEPGDDD